MRVLTVQGAWAWAIVHGPKRIENRSRPFWSYRGPVAIHCGRSKRWDAASIERLTQLGLAPPTGRALDALRGQVLGVCELTDCVAIEERIKLAHAAFGPAELIDGPWCLVLEEPRPLRRAVPATGALGLWRPGEDLAAAIAAAL